MFFIQIEGALVTFPISKVQFTIPMTQITLKHAFIKVAIPLNIHSPPINLTINNVAEKEASIMPNMDHSPLPDAFLGGEVPLNKAVVFFGPGSELRLAEYLWR